MSETVQANDGAMLPLSSLPQSFVFVGGFISTITVEYQGNTYVQTFINDGVNIIYISGWINPEFPSGEIVMITEGGQPMLTEDDNVMIME
jgi:hypothetical protein